MKKELIVIKKSADAGCLIEYSLITDICRNEKNVYAVYGVNIDTVRNGIVTANESVRDISCVKKRVEDFIFYISENEVMPGTLGDIVSDIFEEYGELKCPERKKEFKKVV